MLEAPLAGIHHSGIRLVAGLDRLVVVERATRLDYSRDAFAEPNIYAVSEGKKGITHHGSAYQAALFSGHSLVYLLLLFFVGKVIV